MDSARNKNFSYDKKLQTIFKTIDDDLNTQTVRSLNRLANEKKFLETINPNPNKKVVCPQGLSLNQKQAVRLLRRSSHPSMTLDEFDEKLSATRVHRTLLRRVDEANHVVAEKSKLSEFQINRKLYRRNSKSNVDIRNNTDPVVNVVETQANNVSYPLYRRKTMVGDAYQRITSADVSQSDRRTNDKLHTRSRSDSDIDDESIYNKGTLKDHLPDISSWRKANTARRNTMPDIRVRVLQTVTQEPSVRKTEPKQVSKNDTFDKLINVMKKRNRIPQLHDDNLI